VHTVVIIILSIAGFLISLYFSGIYYGYVRHSVWWVPSFCRPDQQTCSTILHTPEARLFGLPNFVYGLAYYIALIAAVAGAPGGLLFDLLVAASALTVILAVQLIYSLRIRLKTDCTLCYASHAINCVVAALMFDLRYNLL
jgi:uncharacterized membrane protein